MSWGNVAVAAASVIGGYMSSKGSKDAANSAKKGGLSAIGEQRAARESFEQRTEPFRQVGLAAATPLLQSLGIDVSGFDISGERQGIQSQLDTVNQQIADLPVQAGKPQQTLGGRIIKNAPGEVSSTVYNDLISQRDALQQQLTDYDANQTQAQPVAQTAPGQDQYSLEVINPLVSFLRDEGFNQIQEQAAAQGKLRSGGTLKDLTRFNTQLASTVAPQLQQQRFNQLFNLLGIGQNAAVGQGSAALSTANNIGNIMQGIGQAQGQNAMNQGAIVGNTISDLTGVLGNYMQTQKTQDPYFNRSSGYTFDQGTDPFSTVGI